MHLGHVEMGSGEEREGEGRGGGCAVPCISYVERKLLAYDGNLIFMKRFNIKIIIIHILSVCLGYLI